MSFRVLDLNGKDISECASFKEAMETGVRLLDGAEFLVKADGRKADKIDKLDIKWLKWWNDPSRKLVDTDNGFRLI